MERVVINISTYVGKTARAKGGEARPAPQHPIKRRLKELGGRAEGKTLEWLAGEVGCSSAAIRNFMAGRTGQMLPPNYYRMMEVLGVGENYIYNCGPQLEAEPRTGTKFKGKQA